MNFQPQESEHYRIALDAEPALVAVEAVVELICAQGLPSQKAWSSIVKTLATPFLGTLRGIGVEGASNPMHPDLSEEEHMARVVGSAVDLSEHVDHLEKYRLPAETATEEWMRTSEAWDAVTRVWIYRMQEADPDMPHGADQRRG